MDPVPVTTTSRDAHHLAWRVAGVYAAFAALWIFASSRAVTLLAPDAASHEWFEVAKGLAFVLVSGLLIYALVRAAEQRRLDAERYLRDDEERYRLLLGAVHDHALYLLDPEGRVMSWNPGAERVKGWRADEVVGESWHRFFTPEDQAAGRPVELLRHAAMNGEWGGEAQRQRKDGTLFEARVTLIALRRPDASLYG
jgi:PAS domain S-box-containing protein